MAWNPGSLRREKFSFSLALNFAWASTVSPLQPRITVPALSNPALASRNSDASLIHPGVCALGKKYKTTGLPRSEEHTSELQSQSNLVCRLLLEKKKT